MSESEIPEGSKDIRCIVCPTGCLVHVEKISGELVFEGHSCKRGVEYAREEFISPRRILTTTKIPKDRLEETLKLIAKAQTTAPIKMGDTLLENVFGLDINIIASRDLIEM